MKFALSLAFVCASELSVLPSPARMGESEMYKMKAAVHLQYKAKCAPH